MNKEKLINSAFILFLFASVLGSLIMPNYPTLTDTSGRSFPVTNKLELKSVLEKIEQSPLHVASSFTEYIQNFHDNFDNVMLAFKVERIVFVILNLFLIITFFYKLIPIELVLKSRAAAICILFLLYFLNLQSSLSSGVIGFGRIIMTVILEIPIFWWISSEYFKVGKLRN